ncbi:MAG: hypothetical protein MUO34_14625, partial [Ignavibacteriaceae bacterium]|nr:hypothetical protein [Ignavibacteriaceae bacterium]
MFKEKFVSDEVSDAGYSIKYSSRVEKLTALWALSESALGGILHAFKFPFRGMIISSVAVILISMIAKFSDKRGQILKSTFLVIIIKAVISPHSPITAYLAVFLQGLLGELFFLTKKIKFISAIMLGITVSLFNGFQKIIVLTLIYGETLWKTINDFLTYAAEEWFVFSIKDPINFSYWLISFYIGIHLLAGIFAGVLAYRIPESVDEKLKKTDLLIPLIEQASVHNNISKPKKKRWFKPSTLAIFILSAIIILITYFYPESDRFDVKAILIMLGRSLLIIFIWFYYLAPRIKYFIKNYLTKKQNRYSKDIDAIVSAFPNLKFIIVSVWKDSAKLKSLKRLNYFLITALAYL